MPNGIARMRFLRKGMTFKGKGPGMAIRFLGLPLRGWCSAQRIRITVIAGGNHTIMYRWLKEPDEVALRDNAR